MVTPPIRAARRMKETTSKGITNRPSRASPRTSVEVASPRSAISVVPKAVERRPAEEQEGGAGEQGRPELVRRVESDVFPGRRSGDHDPEEEEDEHRPDVDQDHHPGDELGGQHQEQDGGAAEGRDEEQGGMHHVLGGHHFQRRKQRQESDDQEHPIDGGADPVSEAHFSNSGSGGTVSSQSWSRSMSWSISPIWVSEYSYSGDQNRASKGQTSTQIPQYMHRA